MFGEGGSGVMCVSSFVGFICLLLLSEKLKPLVMWQPFPVPFENNFLALKEIDKDFTSYMLAYTK